MFSLLVNIRVADPHNFFADPAVVLPIRVQLLSQCRSGSSLKNFVIKLHYEEFAVLQMKKTKRLLISKKKPIGLVQIYFTFFFIKLQLLLLDQDSGEERK